MRERKGELGCSTGESRLRVGGFYMFCPCPGSTCAPHREDEEVTVTAPARRDAAKGAEMRRASARET
jgi:hypothetical protein